MEDRLKPCPFCGGKAGSIGEPLSNGTEVYYIECLECGASSAVYGTAERAIEAWNTRKLLDRIMEQLEEVSFVETVEEYAEINLLLLDDAIEIVKAGGIDG